MTQTDFTQNVIAMKNAGVKVLFIDQMPENYASALLKDLVQQNFHPMVVLGAATYSHDAGPRGRRRRRRSTAPTSTRTPRSTWARTRPTSRPWAPSSTGCNVASPGFKPDLFTLYGWLSAELFVQALKNAGHRPEPGLAPPGPVQDHLVQRRQHRHHQQPGGQDDVELLPGRPGGQRAVDQRQDDPPVNSSTNGYRCDYSYVTPPAS